MSMILAVALVCLLLLVIFVPAAAAVVRPAWVKFAVPLYALLFVGLLAAHVGFGMGDVAAIAAEKSRSPQTICEQAVGESERAGLIVERSNPSRVVVDGRMWSRLPVQARDAITDCLENMRGPDASNGPVQIVER